MKNTIAEFTGLLSQATDIIRNHGAEEDANYIEKQMENTISNYKSEIENYKNKLEKICEELRNLRDDAPCAANENDTQTCSCHVFDRAIDLIETQIA